MGLNPSWQGTKRKVVYTGGVGLVCKCTGWCTLQRSVQDEGVDTDDANFFNWSLELTNKKRPKVACLVHY